MHLLQMSFQLRFLLHGNQVMVFIEQADVTLKIVVRENLFAVRALELSGRRTYLDGKKLVST